MAKKKTKARAKKAVTRRQPVKVSHELVVRVDTTPVTPTVAELAEPMRDGKKLTIPKTWLSDEQVIRIVQVTPKQHVYTRKGRGGKQFDYVTGAYVEKVLNFVFGWNWDFEVVGHGVAGNFIWVQGKLTARGSGAGQQIVKTQFGRAEIKYLKDSKKTPADYVDFGNDLKAATTDALKKCASLLGVASDIYGKSEYKEETGIEPSSGLPVVQLGVKDAVTAAKERYPSPIKPGQIIGPEGSPTYACAEDGDPIGDQVAAYSLKVYGKRLCREHQAEAKKR